MANVLIQVCSSGIGLATALELGRAGHRVFATMRDAVRSPELGNKANEEGLGMVLSALISRRGCPWFRSHGKATGEFT